MAVDQLEHGGFQPARGHPGDGRAAGRKGVEEPDDGTGGGRAGRPQPHRHLRDHTQRALGADHEPDQVVPRHALRGAPPEAHDLPGRRDHFQRQHVVACHPVLHAAQPAGVRGDVAADRRQGGAGRVGRVPQVVLGGGRAQIVVHHAGLDDRQPLAGVDLDDGAHPFGAQDHAPVHGVRAPGHAGAGATGDDRDAIPSTHAHDVRDLSGAARPHHGQRDAELGPVGLVATVALDHVEVGDQLGRLERGAQVREYGAGLGGGLCTDTAVPDTITSCGPVISDSCTSSKRGGSWSAGRRTAFMTHLSVDGRTPVATAQVAGPAHPHPMSRTCSPQPVAAWSQLRSRRPRSTEPPLAAPWRRRASRPW